MMKLNSPLMVKLFGMLTASAVFGAGFYGFITVNLYALALNVLLLVAAVFYITSEIIYLNTFAYTPFLYTALGKGIFFVVIGIVVIPSNVVRLALGIVIIFMGFVLTGACTALGGVPKPLLNGDEAVASIATASFAD